MSQIKFYIESAAHFSSSDGREIGCTSIKIDGGAQIACIWDDQPETDEIEVDPIADSEQMFRATPIDYAAELKKAGITIRVARQIARCAVPTNLPHGMTGYAEQI